MTKDLETKQPAALSEGAAIALGNVFARLVKPSKDERTGAKRPRADNTEPKQSAPTVLEKDEEVHEAMKKEEEARRKFKENKRAKLAFEKNARVVPDAATNAKMEKELRSIATQGAVALFNAITKAQRAATEANTTDKTKKKKSAVSKDKFLDLIKAGVIKTAAAKPKIGDEDAKQKSQDPSDAESHSSNDGASSEDPENDETERLDANGEENEAQGSSDDGDVEDDMSDDHDDGSIEEEENESEDSDDDVPKKRADWLKEDFMTKGSRKLKDFDRKGEDASDEDSDDASADESGSE